MQKRLPTETFRDEKTILTTPNQPRLDIRSVSKSFGGIRALREVSFVVKPGEVHALIGENGGCARSNERCNISRQAIT